MNLCLEHPVCGVLEGEFVVDARVVVVLLPGVNGTLVEVGGGDVLALRELRDEVGIPANRLVVSSELVEAVGGFIHCFGLQVRVVFEFFGSNFVKFLISLFVVGLVQEGLRDEVLGIVFEIGVGESVQHGFEGVPGVLVVLEFVVELPDGVPRVLDEQGVREVLDELHELGFGELELFGSVENLSPQVG